MRGFIAGLAMGLALLGSTAHAGDPCPIDVKISDLGSPDWLDNLALINALESRQIWIGISYNATEDGLDLTRVYEGSPAESAGLMEGDVITALDGHSALEYEVFERLNIGETVGVTIERGDQRLKLALAIGGADPVPLSMVRLLESTDCRMSELAPPDAVMRQAVMPLLFNANRGFRCEDAHIALEPLMEQYQSDTVFFVRGHRRLLLTMPYYGTVCISAANLDGDNLNDEALGAVINRVIRDYVRERHENP